MKPFKIKATYGNVSVLESATLMCLSQDPNHIIVNSKVTKKERQKISFWYQHHMFLPLAFNRHPRSALSVGLGAGSLVTTLKKACPACYIVALENNPYVLEAAIKEFDFYLHNNVLIADMLDYIRECTTTTTYDLIQIDTSSAYPHNPELYSASTLAKLGNLLTDDGIIVINASGTLGMQAKVKRAVYNVFPSILDLPSGPSLDSVILAWKSPHRYSLKDVKSNLASLDKVDIFCNTLFDPVIRTKLYAKEFEI